MNAITWPAAFLLAVVVVVDGALVWRGLLTPHAITSATSAIVGFIVGRSLFAKDVQSRP